MPAPTDNNYQDPLFFQYGKKPLEKEFQSFEKKIHDYLVTEQGMSKGEAFIAWQLFKLNTFFKNIYAGNLEEIREHLAQQKNDSTNDLRPAATVSQ